MRDDAHQPLRFELHESLADGDAAHAELVGERVLAELRAGLDVAVQDAPAQRLGGGGGDRPMLEAFADPRGAVVAHGSVRVEATPNHRRLLDDINFIQST